MLSSYLLHGGRCGHPLLEEIGGDRGSLVRLAILNELLQSAECLWRSPFRQPLLECFRLLLEKAGHLIDILLGCRGARLGQPVLLTRLGLYTGLGLGWRLRWGWGTAGRCHQPWGAITFAGWRSQLGFRTAIGNRRSIVIALAVMMLQLDLIATRTAGGDCSGPGSRNSTRCHSSSCRWYSRLVGAIGQRFGRGRRRSGGWRAAGGGHFNRRCGATSWRWHICHVAAAAAPAHWAVHEIIAGKTGAHLLLLQLLFVIVVVASLARLRIQLRPLIKSRTRPLMRGLVTSSWRPQGLVRPTCCSPQSAQSPHALALMARCEAMG